MAQAKVTITCSKCGEKINHAKECHNRSEADSYEKWAVANIKICRECLAKAKAEKAEKEAASIIAELGIPAVIEGVSEKQIAYAHKRRNEYIVSHANAMRICAELIGTMEANREQMLAYMAEQNLTETQMMAAIFDGYEKEHLIFKATTASKILENI